MSFSLQVGPLEISRNFTTTVLNTSSSNVVSTLLAFVPQFGTTAVQQKLFTAATGLWRSAVPRNWSDGFLADILLKDLPGDNLMVQDQDYRVVEGKSSIQIFYVLCGDANLCAT
jgi:hypothetical protein